MCLVLKFLTDFNSLGTVQRAGLYVPKWFIFLWKLVSISHLMLFFSCKIHGAFLPSYNYFFSDHLLKNIFIFCFTISTLKWFQIFFTVFSNSDIFSLDLYPNLWFMKIKEHWFAIGTIFCMNKISNNKENEFDK